MALIVDATGDPNAADDRPADVDGNADPDRRRIDVTDLRADGIEEFVAESVDTDRVSLEHRGHRTYLVLEE
ncbi:hypothetical protein SAMN05444422_102501 [Halobiforma haloterrestris]|uniref:Uncharacterized protein n=1 Tax=Natronobacterium haloterrestre TaxID=148448 RepID=A0A1I1EJM9_NATHA|nr:hypothetical protein [Halobiforma haloterrestris]SFB87271.1 hypothetical protein SAMN05444422_102501 [Halobiforma haloterrestris]